MAKNNFTNSRVPSATFEFDGQLHLRNCPDAVVPRVSSKVTPTVEIIISSSRFYFEVNGQLHWKTNKTVNKLLPSSPLQNMPGFKNNTFTTRVDNFILISLLVTKSYFGLQINLLQYLMAGQFSISAKHVKVLFDMERSIKPNTMQ